jgi:hypothetical protein
MNILINGGSLSRGPTSWPYIIQKHFNSKLVNLAQAGSGNTYMHETTISELAQRKYDLVLIQWVPFIRIDYKVQNIELFNNTQYTSNYQYKQNDWPRKIIYPVNDQDYVEKDWIFSCGYAVNKDNDLNLIRAFEDYYYYTGPSEQIYHLLIKMISLQSYLKANSIPYLFCFGRKFKTFDRHSHLFNQLDMNHMYVDQFLLDIAENNNMWDVNDQYRPSPEAYEIYANLLITKIEEIL